MQALPNEERKTVMLWVAQTPNEMVDALECALSMMNLKRGNRQRFFWGFWGLSRPGPGAPTRNLGQWAPPAFTPQWAHAHWAQPLTSPKLWKARCDINAAPHQNTLAKWWLLALIQRTLLVTCVHGDVTKVWADHRGGNWHVTVRLIPDLPVSLLIAWDWPLPLSHISQQVTWKGNFGR